MLLRRSALQTPLGTGRVWEGLHLCRAEELLAWGQIKILRFEEVVNEYLLNSILIAGSFGDLRVVQGGLLLLA